MASMFVVIYFNKFIDEKGKFKESLISDVKGMLELYEAAHFQLHGETILEEALALTMFHLKLAETMMDYPVSTQIANALKRPLRKSLPKWWKCLDVATNFPFIRIDWWSVIFGYWEHTLNSIMPLLELS
ncbi:hypothetical protein Gotur_035304 [Gossypium turneri]